MTWRTAGAAAFGALLVLAVLIFLATPTHAGPSTPITPLAGEFRPVVLPSASPDPDAAVMASETSPASLSPLLEPGTGLPIATARPTVELPTVTAVAEPRATPTPKPTPKPAARVAPAPVAPATSHRISGLASWYCRAGVSVCTAGYPDDGGADLYAAAGPRLRQAICGSDTSNCWRGRRVTVNGLAVKLVDWCQCHNGQSHEKLLDLYWDAWSRVPDVEAGVVVRW